MQTERAGTRPQITLPGPPGSDRPSDEQPLRGIPQVVRPSLRGSEDVSEFGDEAISSGRARTGDRSPETDSDVPAGNDAGAGVGAGRGSAPVSPGESGGDSSRVGDPLEAAGRERWEWFACCVLKLKLGGTGNRSVRTGIDPFSDSPTPDTQRLAETAWEKLREQLGLVQAKHAWLYDNQGHPAWNERLAGTLRSERKLRLMLVSLLAWLGAGPDEAFEMLAVLSGEPPAQETAQEGTGEAQEPVSAVAGTTSHNEPAVSESPLRASYDPTGAIRLPDIPTCYDRVSDTARRLAWPGVKWPAREIEGYPNLAVPARSVSGQESWQAFLAEMVSLRHPRSVDSLFFAELALIAIELGGSPSV